MERKIASIAHRIIFCIDMLLTGAAFLIAYQIKRQLPDGYSSLSTTVDYPFLLILLLFFYSISFHVFSLNQVERLLHPLHNFIGVLKAVIATTAATLLVLYLLHQADVSRLLIGTFVVVDILLLFAARMVRLTLHRYGLRNGLKGREILIIGSHERAKDLIRYLKSVKHFGYNILGCLEVDDSKYEQEVADGVKVIGSMSDFKTYLLNFAVDEVVFAMPLKKIDNPAEHIAFSEELGINVRILPDWQIHKLMYRPEIASIYVEDFAGLPTMALSSTPRRVFELTVKEIFDRSSALLGLLALAPLFLVISLIIKLTSRGPVFFKQRRCGLNGRIFNVYKFRSMVVNAEELRKDLEELNEEDGPAFKIAKDPRVTWIGNLLRKTSLDELPQLINVIKGEMSLVGPRPPLPDEVQQYHPWQRRRLSMKPGITCIWQVSGRNSVAFDQWMQMDLEYIDKWNLWLDFKLLLLTFPAIIFGTGR